MSNRRFVLPVTMSAVLLALIAVTACGGGSAPTVAPAASAPTAQPRPTEAPVAVSSPTSAPAAVEATVAPVVPTPTATVGPSPTPAPVDTPTPTGTPVPAPTATQIPTQVPAATPLPRPFDGTYILIVSQPGGETYSGKTITFKIDGREAAETMMWEQGGVNEMNLTASGTAQIGGQSAPAGRGRPLAAPLLQAPPLAPHVFVGTAAIDGRLADQGSSVSAWVDGVQVPGAEATVEASPTVSASSAGPVGQSLAVLGDNLVRVWRFDAATQAWTFYDPRALFGGFNSIKELSSGQFYYVVTKNGQTADLNGQPRTLWTGWTPLVW